MQQDMTGTHILESQGQKLLAGLKKARHGTTHILKSQGQPLSTDLKNGSVIAATHFLMSQGQASSVGFKCSKTLQPLTV
jgi:hypothetical protein